MDDSLFVSAEIAEKTIRLSDGSKHVFHFRHLDNVAWEVYAAQVNSASPRWPAPRRRACSRKGW